MKRLKRYLRATKQEWPWAVWSRNLLLVGVVFCFLSAIPAVVNGPIPARQELSEVTGLYQAMEVGEDIRLKVATAPGVTEEFRIPSYTTFDRSAFAAAVTPGDEIALGATKGTIRFVMELTAAGETYLPYDQARQDEWNNNYLALLVSACLTVLSQGLCALWWGLKKKKEPLPLPDYPERAEPPKPAPKPQVYTREERREVEEYIVAALGQSTRVYYDTTGQGVDIALIAPSPQEPFYRLATIGLGGRRMELPPDLQEMNQAFVELVVYLPPEWNPDGDPRPFQILRRVAQEPCLTLGSVVHCTWGEYSAIMLSPLAARESFSGRILITAGKVINFYQLLPILPREDEFRREEGSFALWQRMKFTSPIVAEGRACCIPEEPQEE